MKKIVLLLLVFFLFMVNFSFVAAYNDTEDNPTGETKVPAPTSVTMTSPIKETDANKYIGGVINKALGVVGSIGLALFTYGGFVWMLAAGNSEKVSQAKSILAWTAIGMVIIFIAYALVSFIIVGVAPTGT